MKYLSLTLIAFVFAALSYGQECPPDIAVRLIAAGVAEEDVRRFCPAAEALVGRSIVIHAGDELLDDFIRLFLPFGTEFALNDARYCGAVGPHGVELLAVGTSDATVPSATSLTTEQCASVAACDDTESCETLTSIAGLMRPPGADTWAVAARMRLEWSPWRLTLSAIDAASSGIPEDSWVEKRAKLLDAANARVIETTAAALPTPAGSLPSLPSSTAFYFENASFAMVISPAAALTGLDDATAFPPLRVISGDNTPAAGANASLVFAHHAINQFATNFLSQTPLPIQTDHRPPGDLAREIVGPADLTSVNVIGSASEYKIAGNLKQGTGGYFVEIMLQHDDAGDLSIRDVKFQARGPHCNGNLSCLAADFVRRWRAGLAQIGAVIVLQGKPWVAYLDKHEMELPWGPDIVGLRGTIRRIHSNDEALVMSGNLRLRRKF